MFVCCFTSRWMLPAKDCKLRSYAWHLWPLIMSTGPRTLCSHPKDPPAISTKNTEGPYLPGSSRGKSGHDKKTPLYWLNYFCTILSIFISKMLLISNINGDKTQLNYHFCIFFKNFYEKKWFVTLLVYGMISSFNLFWIHVRITVIVS